MTPDMVLGYCIHLHARVTDETCLNCFTALDDGGADRRRVCGLRTRCVERCIVESGGCSEITTEDLNALTEASLRHIIGNATMIAQAHPHEVTAQTLIRETRLHLKEGP